MPKKKELQLPTDVAINTCISKVDVYYTLVYAKKKRIAVTN